MPAAPSNVIRLTATRSSRDAARVSKTKVLHVVADEDGLIELAPVVAALGRRGCFEQLAVHVGHGLDGIPPDGQVSAAERRLAVGPGTQAETTAALLIGFERLLLQDRPEVVLVGGGGDAALAAALTAARLGTAVAHLGAGARAWDWTRPGELNRSVIDQISDTLFTAGPDGAANLRAEGIPDGRIHEVGNSRIDMVRRYEARSRTRAAWRDHGVRERAYTLVAFQHPRTLEGPGRLKRTAQALVALAGTGAVLVLTQHATRRILATDPAVAALAPAGVRFAEAPGYLDRLSLMAGAGAIVTDAGGVQADASALGVPCFTFAAATACTATLTHGTNVLLGEDPGAIAGISRASGGPTPALIPLWDGRASERIADALVANYTLAGVSFEEA